MANMTSSDTVLTVQGVAIPRLGFGTWQMGGREAREGVRDALAIGYRHIDTAQLYRNEAEVGAGIADSGVDRDDIWVTTKIMPSDFEPARLKAAAAASLRALGLEQVDLLLLHWPSGTVPLEDTLAALHEVQEEGGTRHIGVSNFSAALLERSLGLVPLLADQVEYHPFNEQDAVLEVARERDLTLTAYSPLDQGAVARSRELAAIGEQYGKSASQVALRWLLDQPNLTVIPKTSSHDRRVENFDVFDFTLSDADRERIAALQRR
jgi:2,5-diketo-D-gluconate reductase B